MIAPTLPAQAEVAPPSRNLSFGGVGGNALRTLLRLLVKRRITVIGVLLLALIAGVMTILFSTPKFRAIATLEISREIAPVVETGDRPFVPTSIDQEFYETQFGLLRGRAIARDVGRKLNLANNPRFVAPAADNQPMTRALREERERETIRRLQDSIEIVPARQSRLVDVRVIDPDPVLAARIANTVADTYIRQNLEKRVDRTAYAREFLDQRIQEVRVALENSERRLVGYAGREQIISVPTTSEEGRAASGTASQSLAGSDLAATSQALVTARAARAEAESRWQAAQAGGANRSEVLSNVAINSLLARRAELQAEAAQIATNFDEEYPPLRAKRAEAAQITTQIRSISSQISNSLRSDFQAAASRERDLAGQVDVLKGNIIDLSNRSIQYTILQREVDTNRALYEGLLQQYKEASVAADLGTNNVAFVLRADAPVVPYSPNVSRIMLISFFVGLLGAIALVMLLEVLDARISSPEDFRERLDAPLLGIIPTTTEEDPIDELANPRSPLTEAYSSTHANLRFTTPEGAPRILTVSSTKAGEGKTTTSVAISAFFARRGERVLLIDGDLRRPTLHRRLDFDNTEGFSNLLAGEPLSPTMIKRYETLGIDVITSGPLPPSPADLLANPRLNELLRSLRDRYDRILVDAPPVLGLADAPLLATAGDGLLFVVEAGGPRLGPIRRAVERITDLRGKIVGFVFTKYSMRRSIFTEYSSYEYYGYGQTKKKNLI